MNSSVVYNVHILPKSLKLKLMFAIISSTSTLSCVDKWSQGSLVLRPRLHLQGQGQYQAKVQGLVVKCDHYQA